MAVLSGFFSVMAGVTAFVGFLLYLIFLIRLSKKTSLSEDQKPNATSWMIWFMADALNLCTYFMIVEGDFLEMLFLSVYTMETFVVLTFLIHYKYFRKPDFLEIIILVASFFLILYFLGNLLAQADNPGFSKEFFFSNSSRNLYLVLQVFYFLGFIPIIKRVLKNKNFENSLLSIYSWSLTALGAMFSIIAISCNFHGDLYAFISPIIFLIGDTVIAILFLRLRKKYLANKRKIWLRH